ncbi:uroporphyrinogen-III synthase [Lutimaribacter marinistellae]|uniref:Uroporphyrinogen-III synthase n=1 Tax=Lutimaribacter marinistellae TaxID=1820329 RepID=A0ABV7TF78_9RHOB
MTRPQLASERFLAQLPQDVQAQVTAVHSPLLDIRPTDTAIELDDIRGLVFTSINGVAIASHRIDERNLPVFCVGEATTAAAERAGWQARFSGESSEALIATLLEERPASPLLHLRGEHSRGNLAETLTQLGLSVSEAIIYEQQLLPFTEDALAALDSETPVLAPLFSPRTARQFADLHKGRAPLFLAALSDAVAKPLETLPFERLKVAKRPDAEAMARTVEKMIRRAIRVEGK